MNTENNKLIAEFMGVDQVDIDTWLDTNPNLKYDTSWDWIMVVVDKIQLIDDSNFCITIDQNVCKVWSEDNIYQNEVVKSTTIDTVYQAVVEFIKWYNQQKENSTKTPIQIALDHVREFFPKVCRVQFGKDGIWYYTDANFEAPNFEDVDIEQSILEDALNNVPYLPFIYEIDEKS